MAEPRHGQSPVVGQCQTYPGETTLGALLPCPLEPTVGRPCTSSELRGFAPPSERMRVGSAEHSPIKLVDDFVQFNLVMLALRTFFKMLWLFAPKACQGH